MALDRLSAGGEGLDEDLPMPAGHRDENIALFVKAPGHRSDQCQRRISEHFGTPGDRKRARGGEADPGSGKAAGAERDENAIVDRI